jgi:hypothetical protein
MDGRQRMKVCKDVRVTVAYLNALTHQSLGHAEFRNKEKTLGWIIGLQTENKFPDIFNRKQKT